MTLDWEQLREVTLEDVDLMRDIVVALVEDTSQNLRLLQAAVEAEDSEQCMRLAHYSKGACANVGAFSAATLLRNIEQRAAEGEFGDCNLALRSLAEEVELLRVEARALGA